MTEFAPDAGFRKNRKLKAALLRHKAFSKEGLSERLFGLLFSGLVYPQIWEDPDLDMQAMELEPHHRIVTIGSGGCNMLAYLSRSPGTIDVVDLNPHHIALNKLKLSAFRHLPARADLSASRRNPASHNSRPSTGSSRQSRRHHAQLLERPHVARPPPRHRVRPQHLQDRPARPLHRRRPPARPRPRRQPRPVSPRHSRSTNSASSSTRKIAPLFEKACRALDHQPQERRCSASAFRRSNTTNCKPRRRQFDRAGAAPPSGKARLSFPDAGELLRLAGLRPPLRRRRRRPAADLPEAGALRSDPRQCRSRQRPPPASFTELLAGKPAASRDRYVLLDAQDWMTDQQLNDVWSEIIPHRPRRRPRHLPHCRRKKHHRRPRCRPPSATSGPISKRARRNSPRSTARRSTAASTST
jgi:S-adenosylmethionine-diacylglycerol 3-amino-3-carboxypropyl transferase